MIEQINLFETVPTEEWVYEVLYPTLTRELLQSNAGPNNLKMDRGKEYSSVSYIKQDPYEQAKPGKKQLAFRICCREGMHYFGISDSYLDDIPQELSVLGTKANQNDGFTNFEFDTTYEGIERYAKLLSAVLGKVTYSIPKEFDCCSRFEQCSDAKRCIHPNSSLATSCGYRKILRTGKIFYGKNRNVD